MMLVMRCSKMLMLVAIASTLCLMLVVSGGNRFVARAESANPCMNVDVYAGASVAALNLAASARGSAPSSRTRRLKYVAAAISEYRKLNRALGDMPNAASSDAPLCENMLNLQYWEMLNYWARVSVAEAISDNLSTSHAECRHYLDLEAQTLVAEGYAFINGNEGDIPLSTQLSTPYAASGYPGHSADVESFQRAIALAATKLKMNLPDAADASSYLEQRKQDREMAAVTLDQSCEHQSRMPLAILVIVFPQQ